MRVKSLFVAISCSMLFIACNSTKQVTKANNTPALPQKVEGCNSIAIVKNFTHESGCQYLFKMEDGSLILPGEMPVTKVPFYEGAGLKIGYEILNSNTDKVNTMCGSHDYVAKITCIEQYLLNEDVPASHAECQTIKDPSKFTWMREAIAKEKPNKVKEYPYSVGFIYELEFDSSSILFDCLGNQLCNTKESEDCTSLLETLSDPKVILVTNN